MAVVIRLRIANGQGSVAQNGSPAPLGETPASANVTPGDGRRATTNRAALRK